MKKVLILLIIGFLCVPILKAQETKEKSDTMEYKYPFEVLITAPRFNVPLRESPFSTSVIDQRILNTMPRTLAADEPFKLVPGVKIDNQADGERLHMSIRGQGILSEHGIRGTKILLDGIPLNDPTGFTPDFYDVQWPRVKSIEILKGASASLYGGSSTAGIINIITNSSPSKPFSGQGFFSSGSFNTWQAYGLLGTGWKNGNANVSLSREMGDGYRMHTHFWADKLWAKSDVDVSSKFHLTPVFGYVDYFNENPEGLNRDQVTTDPRTPNPDAIPSNELMHTQRYTGGISGVINISKIHSLMFTGYIRGTKYEEAVPHDIDHRTMTSPGGSLQYNMHFGRKNLQNTVSIGGDVQYQTIDEYFRDNLGGAIDGPVDLANYKIKQTGYGVFLADRLELGTKWSGMLNIRYDGIKNELDDNMKSEGVDLSGNKNFSRATGRLGLTYSPNKNWNLFADYGMGFLPPATEELDANPNAVGGFNQNLTFATSQGPEIGIRGEFGKKYYFDLTGYYLNTKNDFDRYRVADRPLETFYMNSKGTNRIGAEFYTRLEPVRLITLQIAYTYSNFKYSMGASDSVQVIMDDTTIHKSIKNGNWLPNIPQHQLMVDLQFNILKNFSIAVTSETYSRTYIDGANILVESVGGFTLYGARATYTSALLGTKTEVSINARNIFSRRWIAFTEPDPGGNSYQPGTPLQVYLNAKIGF
ncbi:MAG: TonB-dependent receptor [Ignavibacteria bacterium]|jgi:iron complex outermembrane receptor protein